MKRNIFYSATIVALTLLLNLQVNAQVAINATGTQPNDCAMLDVASTSKGILIPRMSQAQRDAISNPSSGLLIYQTSDESFYYWEGGVWYKLGSQWVNNGTSIYYPNRIVLGGSDGDASAALDVQSTAGGVLVPRMTENDKNNIINPAIGLLIYQTDGAPGFYYHNGVEWTGVGGLRVINVSSPLTSSGGTEPTIGLEMPLRVNQGGTGAQTFATNGILYGSGTSAISSNTTFVRSVNGSNNLIGIGTASPNSTLHANGSFSTAFATKGINYTLTLTDNCVVATTAGITITLPSAAMITGRNYTIKNTSTGSVTVVTTGGQYIDGLTTYTLSAQYNYVTVISNGSKWLIIGQN